MALIPKFYLDSVLSIGYSTPDGVKWIATGFIAARKTDEDHFQPYLVTNKHVLKDQDVIILRLKKNDGTLMTTPISVKANDEKLYSEHPDNDVDVAVVLLNGSFFEKNDLLLSAIDIDENALTSTELIEQGGGEGSYVYMLGYPMGLVDVDSNAPICRGGCIARADDHEIARTKNMLLDIQNFPGNSGSPIILKPEVLSIEGTKALGRSVLIGIIHSYISYEDQLISAQTHRVVEIRSENSGIAECNPVEYIREVVDLECQRLKKKEREHALSSDDNSHPKSS